MTDNTEELDELIATFCGEVMDLYKYSKEKNRKLVMYSNLLRKLERIDEISEKEIDYVMEAINTKREVFNIDDMKKLNEALNKMNENIVSNIFLKNTLYKKMLGLEAKDKEEE